MFVILLFKSRPFDGSVVGGLGGVGEMWRIVILCHACKGARAPSCPLIHSFTLSNNRNNLIPKCLISFMNFLFNDNIFCFDIFSNLSLLLIELQITITRKTDSIGKHVLKI